MKKKKENLGYFTVEAALLFPIVIAVILFVFLCMFYSYDRLLLEQDIGILALRGTVDGGDKEEIGNRLIVEAGQIYTEKYVALKREAVNLQLKGFSVELEQKASLALWMGDVFRLGPKWEMTAHYRNKRIEPAFFLRLVRRITKKAG